MAGKQIKQIRIETVNVGSKEAAKEIRDLEGALIGVKDAAAGFIGVAARLSPSMTSLSKSSAGIGSAAENLVKVSTALKGINSATAGTAAQSKKLDGYITNLEVLTSVLRDVGDAADLAEASLDGVNATAGMRSLLGVLENIAESTEQTARYIADLDLVTSQAGERFDEYAKDVRRANSATKGLGKTTKEQTELLKQQNRETKNQTRSFSALAFGANPLVTTYAAIAVNIYALSAAFNLLKEAASFDRLQSQLNSFSASVSGLDVSALAVQMKEASDGALSLRESLAFATKGTAFNFNTKQLVDLTEGARKASIALGIDFTDAMDRVLRGISKQEIELFDELGVVTRLTPAFQAYAGAIGKSVDQLTDYERQLALTIEVQGQLDEKFSGIEVASTAWETLAISTKDATNSFLIFLSQALEPVVEGLNEVIENASILSNIEIVKQKSVDQAETFAKALSAGNLGQAINSAGGITDTISNIDSEMKKVQDRISGIRKDMTFTDSGDALGVVAEKIKFGAGEVADTILDLATTYLNLSSTSGIAESVSGFSESIRSASTNYGELTALEKLSNAQTEEKNKLLKQYADQVREIVKQEGLDPSAVNTDTAQAVLGYVNSLKEGQQAVDKLVIGNNLLGGSLDGLISTYNNMNAVVKEASGFTEELRQKNFDELKASLNLDDSITSISALKSITERLNVALIENSRAGAKDGVLTGAKDEDIKNLDLALDRLRQIQTLQNKLGSTTSLAQREETDHQVSLTEKKLEQLRIDRKLSDNLKQNTILFSKQTAIKEGQAHFESDLLDLRIKQLVVQEALNRAAKKDTSELRRQITLLELQSAEKKKQEDIDSANISRNSAIADFGVDASTATSNSEIVGIRQSVLNIQKQINATETDALTRQKNGLAISLAQKLIDRDRAQALLQDEVLAATADKAKLNRDLQLAGSEKARVVIQEKLLALRRMEVAAMDEGIAKVKAQAELGVATETQGRNKASAPFQDASSVFSAAAALPGISDVQSAGLGLAESFSDVFAEAAQNGMEGFAGFTEFLSGNMEAFQSFSQGVADGLGAVFQASSDAKVAAIDLEIAAEQRRDGQSAKSVAKIKALETKKIKEQAKAKKAQVIMSTAAAIALSFAELGPIAGAPAAAIMAGMGVLQIAAINKAANGQISALDTGGGSTDMKIEGGSRANEIDVSRNSNAGELSFINGGQGQGTANNFSVPGRAAGGTANNSITVGERGKEVITPLVPVSVAPAGRSNEGTGGFVFSPIFNVDTVGSEGFESVTSRFSVELFNSLEKELNARNLSLENLR